VYKLINPDGSLSSSTESIMNSFSTFYKHVYSAEPVDSSLNHMFLDNLPSVCQEDNDVLSSHITLDEIRNALKDMKPDKSPGSGGLTSAFYLKYFTILGDVLLKVFNICYESGEMSEPQKCHILLYCVKIKTILLMLKTIAQFPY